MPGLSLFNYGTKVNLENIFDERCVQGELNKDALWIKP